MQSLIQFVAWCLEMAGISAPRPKVEVEKILKYCQPGDTAEKLNKIGRAIIYNIKLELYCMYYECITVCRLYS